MGWTLLGGSSSAGVEITLVPVACGRGGLSYEASCAAQRAVVAMVISLRPGSSSQANAKTAHADAAALGLDPAGLHHSKGWVADGRQVRYSRVATSTRWMTPPRPTTGTAERADLVTGGVGEAGVGGACGRSPAGGRGSWRSVGLACGFGSDEGAPSPARPEDCCRAVPLSRPVGYRPRVSALPAEMASPLPRARTRALVQFIKDWNTWPQDRAEMLDAPPLSGDPFDLACIAAVVHALADRAGVEARVGAPSSCAPAAAVHRPRCRL